MSEPEATLDLWDYRRRVFDIYAAVRADDDPGTAWELWREQRHRLFAHHPQSALDAAQRVAFRGLHYYAYDPQWRFEVEVTPADPTSTELAHSAAGSTGARRFGATRFHIGGDPVSLTLFWLEQYGGGVFLPFGDATNGDTTYGGGRYLLDTAKGADLGHAGSRIILDFNFAYSPSCAHNPNWSCPLSPPENRLPSPVAAGERLSSGV